ncbi:endonuclease domain-containing protein [Streptomyces sp. enrichment culture]|uniref:endonuclease domain-containing protein n=1 Tax=Streptomyces sp. enrichment culture TaxID=1795815 RepID=UPI003F57DD36
MINEPVKYGVVALPDSLRSDYGHGNAAGGSCVHAVTHGLSCAQYEAMRDRAQDCCELCHTPGPDTKRGALVIDHFEGMEVRFVRGLLCDRCNALMARHDGMAPWGPSTEHRKNEARAYHLAAFSKPTAEVFARADEVIAERCRALASRFEPRPPRKPVAPDLEIEAIAEELWARLSGLQISRLAGLLLAQLHSDAAQ